MSDELVRCGSLANGAVALATLVREKPLNSLLLETIDELTVFLDRSLDDSSVRCMILDSSTPRAFCAGADIADLYHAIRSGHLDRAEQFFLREYTLDYRLHESTRPVIAWGQGIVMGGGLGLLGGCSHRVGTPDTRIAMPEITIGLFPDAGGTAMLSSMPDHLGLFAGLTGCQLSAADARQLGLLDYIVTADARDRLDDLLEQLDWSVGESEIHSQLDSLLRTLETDAGETRLLKHREAVQGLIQSALDSNDFIESFDDGLERLDRDEWLQQAIDTYRQGCPVTARIFVEQMTRARGMSLADMFRQELVIAYQCIRHPDFPEGVRALLVDKDRNPKWSFKTAADVPSGYVADHFVPAWSGAHPLDLL